MNSRVYGASMANDERERIKISPGNTLKLFEKLGIFGTGGDDAVKAAMALSTSHVSDRSVALLIRESADKLQVGSGVCVRIGGRYLVATVRHNLQDDDERDLNLSHIEVRPRGEKWGAALKVDGVGLSPDLDLAWLELNPEPFPLPNLHFVSAGDFACLREEDDLQPCLVQGYPAASVERPTEAQGRPLLESDPLMTLSIAPSRRKGPPDHGTFAVEWPPHDGSLDEILPNPHGISGGGVWRFSKLQDHDVWSPERSSLVGLAGRWRIQEKEEVVVRIEFWLELVATQIPELGVEIMEILQRIHLRAA
jgi:hypothetical protein